MAKYKKSIVYPNANRCVLADRSCQGGLETHHILFGTDRKKADKYNLTAPLCSWHHKYAPNAPHVNGESANLLKAYAQKAFEKHYPHLDWLRVFGRNYAWILEDDDI